MVQQPLPPSPTEIFLQALQPCLNDYTVICLWVGFYCLTPEHACCFRGRSRVQERDKEPLQERFFRPHFLQAPGDMVAHEGRLCRLDCKVACSTTCSYFVFICLYAPIFVCICFIVGFGVFLFLFRWKGTEEQRERERSLFSTHKVLLEHLIPDESIS